MVPGATCPHPFASAATTNAHRQRFASLSPPPPMHGVGRIEGVNMKRPVCETVGMRNYGAIDDDLPMPPGNASSSAYCAAGIARYTVNDVALAWYLFKRTENAHGRLMKPRVQRSAPTDTTLAVVAAASLVLHTSTLADGWQGGSRCGVHFRCPSHMCEVIGSGQRDGVDGRSCGSGCKGFRSAEHTSTRE